MGENTKDIKNHQRILNTFTSVQEKRLLRWIAQRLPSWISSDTLTIVGVSGALVIFVGYGLCNLNPAFLWLVNLGFVINWFGDSLDGTLARVRHTERPVYGFYVDHATDAFDEMFIFLGIGISPYVQFEIASLALVGYLILSVLVYVRTCVKGEFTISYGRLGPTEVRLIAITVNTLVFFFGNPTISISSITLTFFDWGALAVATLLFIIAVTTTIRQSRILAEVDPPASP